MFASLHIWFALLYLLHLTDISHFTCTVCPSEHMSLWLSLLPVLHMTVSCRRMRVRAWAPKICKYITWVGLVLSVEYRFFVGWVEERQVRFFGANWWHEQLHFYCHNCLSFLVNIIVESPAPVVKILPSPSIGKFVRLFKDVIICLTPPTSETVKQQFGRNSQRSFQCYCNSPQVKWSLLNYWNGASMTDSYEYCPQLSINNETLHFNDSLFWKSAIWIVISQLKVALEFLWMVYELCAMCQWWVTIGWIQKFWIWF